MNTIHPYGKINYECWLPVYAHRYRFFKTIYTIKK